MLMGGEIKRRMAQTLALVAFVVAPGGSCRAASSIPADENVGIVVNRQGEWQENHAAQELSRYLLEITGKKVPVLDEGDRAARGKKYLFLVGETSVSKGLAEKGLLEIGEIAGSEGFLIKSVREGGKDYLALLGGKGTGTLYAVYTYLEDYLRVGFFSDGDRVWKSEELAFGGIDRREKPRFDDRITLWCESSGGVYRGQMWDLDEWQQVIDWMAQNKLNRFMIGFGLSDAKRYPPQRREMLKQVFHYMKERGVAPIHWNPDRELGGIKEAFGDDVNEDHLYIIGGGEGRERYANFLRRYRKAKEIDPATKRVYHDLWHLHGLVDPPELVKEYLSQLPPDVIVGAIDNLRKIDPLYKKYDYFWGREWYFAWLQGFGGGDFIGGHDGSLRRDVIQLREVAGDPRASKCRGMTLWSENSYFYFHPMYGYVLSRLAWDPLEVHPDGIFKKYARLRYGERSARNMERCIREVLKWSDVRDLGGNWVTKVFVPRKKGEKNTGYSPQGISHRDANEGFGGFRGDTSMQYESVMKKAGELRYLRKALEYALREKDSLNGDWFYESDLTEMTRTYLAALFELHLVKMYQAYKEMVLSYMPDEIEGLKPGEGAKILFREDFSMEGLPSGWQSYTAPIGKPYEERAVWRIDGGALTEMEGGWGKKVVLNEETMSLKDYCLKVRFKVEEPGYTSIGIIFRGKNNAHFCSVGVEPHVGNIALRYTHSAEYVTGTRMSSVAAPAEVTTGKWHELVIRVTGDNVKVYFDGWLKFDHSDERLGPGGGYEEGGIGFYLSADRGTVPGGKTIHLDEIELWAPQAAGERSLPPIRDPARYERNREKFEEEAQRLNQIVEELDKLLSTRTNHSMDDMFEKMRKVGDEDYLRRLKQRFIGSGWLGVYERRDPPELVHLVYRKEVKAYIDELRQRLENREVHFMSVTGRYKENLAQISEEFMENPVKCERLYPGTTTELVEEIYRSTSDWPVR